MIRNRHLKWSPLFLLLMSLIACGPTLPESDSQATNPDSEVSAVSPLSSTMASPTAQSSEIESAADPTVPPTPEITQAELQERYAEYEIITLLPPDAIPAIDDPVFISTTEADEAYDPDELIIGVEFNGQARAYSVPLLSNHEIVNDEIDGIKFAVTW